MSLLCLILHLFTIQYLHHNSMQGIVLNACEESRDVLDADHASCRGGGGGGRLVWEERYRLSAVVVGREMTLFSVCE